MKTKMIRLFLTASLAILVLFPLGCRSKKTVEPEVTPIETERAVSVPAPADDFVVDRSGEDEIDWSDIDELNRLAAERGWLRHAFYEYDSSLLSDKARAALSDSARWLSENPQYTLVVEGHCDERGTEQYNLALGERRSHVAKQYLTGLGISPDRLRMISYGESQPFAVGSFEEAHSQNRRAHLRISGKLN